MAGGVLPSAGPGILVGVGGAAGAVLRHFVSSAVDVEGFPAGTFAVNVVGSFALALVTFLGAGDRLLLLVGTGACGSFTTFSSFSVETVALWEDREYERAVGNAAGNLLGAFAGIGLAAALAGVV